MSASTTSKISFGLAAMDLTIATVCAIYGDSRFAWFMILAGLMWAQGMYFRTKAKEEIGE